MTNYEWDQKQTTKFCEQLRKLKGFKAFTNFVPKLFCLKQPPFSFSFWAGNLKQFAKWYNGTNLFERILGKVFRFGPKRQETLCLLLPYTRIS